ncbi:GNAT family N-acetyltransferase [Psychrobium sp. 1_MG-2023]|uniref:GNAT family N-acetyltransferase n=1 Tax=Psychrobium sp. 1_MG-2023 TaxID=3062624 RepID=UPI000C3279F2|nr:GNAT family N-acetyltransferase [Psychrobium sp. 1_MG-2023]MDP2560849.1 GNAT family N-acetyltransferase [Psychrobium sp. 1_MG-2023]PKF56723.1 hypothetical protein CW748_09600 [Alteromonadales bacterium alter-6D02]
MNVNDYKSLHDLPESAHLLMRRQAANNLYLSELWFSTMMNAGLEADAQVSIYVVENDQQQCLALAFLRTPAGQNGSKFAHWVLSRHSLAGLTNFQSSFFSVLVDDEDSDSQTALVKLIGYLVKSKPRWHLIDLNLMAPQTMAYKVIHQTLNQSNFYCQPYLYKGNWYERFAFADFEQYVSSRSKSNKKAIKNYQRKCRKLQRQQRMTIKLFSQADEAELAVGIYLEIYQQSWKEPDLFEQFYPQLIRRAAAQGRLRFLCIYLDGNPVAFEFAIVTGTQCVMMRTAYIQAYQHDSVGAIAIMLMVEHVIEQDGVTELDFGTDDDRYKQTWVTQRRERYGLVSFNRATGLGRFYHLIDMINRIKATAKDRIKAVIKQEQQS